MLIPVAGLALACSAEEPTGPTARQEVQRTLAPGVSPAAVTTSTTVAQTGDVGRYTSLAVGSDGRRHVTYYDATNGDLKYATCASNCASAGSWTKGAIDKTGNVGVGSSLKISADGRRYVTYSDITNHGLKFATCGSTATCTAAADWTKTPIDLAGFGSFGSALALGQGGTKEVSYRTGGFNLDLRFAVCLTACGQAVNWFRVLLDQTSVGGYPSSGTSLVIGPDGRRHISYFDGGEGDLRYATCAGGCYSALGWQNSLIDIGGVGPHSSLAVGPWGVLHVSYYDYTNGNLKYARCGFDCGGARSWKKVTVASLGDVGLYPSLAVEANGRVHVSFYSQSGTALYYATCNTNCTMASSWTRAVLDGVLSAAGEYPSLAARDGVVQISYYDRSNSNLKYLNRTP
jgi:hypothetical protein